MSHIVTIKVQITDLDALRQACEMRGLRYRQNVQGLTAPSRAENCVHVIEHPTHTEAYKIGLVRSPDTTHWQFLCDADVFDRRIGRYGLYNEAGENGEILMQYYAACCAKNEAEQQGLVVTISTDADGNLVVDCDDVYNTAAQYVPAGSYA